jgi:hypothetical protein
LTLPRDEITAKAEPVPPTVVEEPKKEPQPAAPPSAEPVKPEPAIVKEEVATPKKYQAVLELFRSFDSQPSIEAFTALFAKRESDYSQEPGIAIADGKSTVRIVLSNLSGETAPNFAFTSARAVSVTKKGDAWVIAAEPGSGTLTAGITVLSEDRLTEFPLTTSPYVDVDLDRSGVITEADFMLYLKERGKTTGLKFDLNRDGRRDYIDDFIFTANYLVSKDKGLVKGVAQQKPPK